MSENELTQTEQNLKNNPEVAKQIADFVNDPSTGVVFNMEERGLNRYAQADVEFSEHALAANAPENDVKEEDGVEVEEVEDGDISGTGEDADWDEDEDDEDDEDEDEDDDEEDEEYSDKSIENL